MWAMIPMFRVFSIDTGRSVHLQCHSSSLLLVPEMGESLVAFSHPVGFFFALDRPARVLGRVKNLERELLRHTLPATLPGETHDPAARQRQPALRPDLDRHLVGGAADPPRLDLEQRAWRCAGPTSNTSSGSFFACLPARASAS